MIFASKNENGASAIDAVASGSKTVTRRKKPVEIGKMIAACPGRGKKAVCRLRVLSCEPDEDWSNRNIPRFAEAEARREGFQTWDGLWVWLRAHNPERAPLYRIEFKRESFAPKIEKVKINV